MKRAERIGILTCLLSILLLVNTAIAVEKEISDKKDAEYHIKLAKEYVEKNQFNEAIEEYTKAISLKPDDASLYYARASCYRQNAQIEKAIKDYEQLVIILYNSLDSSIISFNRGDFENTPEKAQKLKDKIRAQESEISAFANLVSLIDLYKQGNRLEDAINFCSKVISLRPKDFTLYRLRADLYEKLKQYDKAIRDYTKVIELTEIERELAEIEKWQPYGKSEKESFFYDKTSIRKQPEGHIRVWTKIKVDDVSAYIERRKKNIKKLRDMRTILTVYIYGNLIVIV